MDKKLRKATKAQRERIVNMLDSGLIDRDEAQKIITKPRNLSPGHYCVPVTYASLPGMRELEKKYLVKGNVSTIFDGRSWTRHASCAEIDQTPGEREFWDAEVPRQFLGKSIHECWDEIAAYFDALGYRFSIETEAIEFADAYPDPQRNNWIYALGSSALNDDGYQCVALLGAGGRGRFLRDGWVVNELGDGVHLLLVLVND